MLFAVEFQPFFLLVADAAFFVEEEDCVCGRFELVLGYNVAKLDLKLFTHFSLHKQLEQFLLALKQLHRLFAQVDCLVQVQHEIFLFCFVFGLA